MTRPRVVVIGGGIAGLTAASATVDEFRRLGVDGDVRLVESANDPGGHARTASDEGFLIESGPNGFLDRDPEILALIAELRLESRVVEASAASRRRFIVRKRRLVKVPDSPLSFITSDSLSWRGKLRILREPWAAAAPPGVEETVFDFAARRIGAEAAETFVDTIISGISGGDSRALALKSQFPLLFDWESKHGSLLRAALAERKPGPRKRTRLLAFDRGLGTLTGALAQRLGDRVSTGVAVRAVERGGEGWNIGLADGSAVPATHVIFATPAHAASRLVAVSAPNLASALAAIPYSGLAVAALAFRRSDVSHSPAGYGYLVPRSEGLATLGVLWESSIFPGRAPADRVLLRVMLGGARRPDVVDLDEHGLLTVARAELKMVMGVSALPERSWVFRWPRAIAQYNVGHIDRLKAIDAALAETPGLSVCGTAYHGVSFTDAVKSGRNAARTFASSMAGPS